MDSSQGAAQRLLMLRGYHTQLLWQIEDGEHQEQPQEWLGAAVTGVSFVANSHPVALWYAGKAVVKTAAMSAKTVAGYAMATSGECTPFAPFVVPRH